MAIDKNIMKNSTNQNEQPTNSINQNEQISENGKKRKEERPPTKIVVRHLPTNMTEEEFKLQVAPLPDFDYFYFVPADKSLLPNAYARAYINFIDQSDLIIFTQKFDGYVFIDSKGGGEFPAIVEFAPFQRIPRHRPNRRKDPKVGTIESDPDFIQFKEEYEAMNLENKSGNMSKQHFFETSLEPEKKEESNTPLLDFIKHRRAERIRIREEKREERRKKDLERKKVKDEQRKVKKEDDTTVAKVLNTQTPPSGYKERIKDKDAKPGYAKKKPDDVKHPSKEKLSPETRPKPRSGKSYLEERQRQAERREEQKKKLSQTQSAASTTDTIPSQSSEDKNIVSDESGSESKVKEVEHKDKEYKKNERSFKRDENKRTSYKNDKRDKELEERRSKRASDKIYQNSRRDDERYEETGRKRYSETRRNQELLRDKNKDRDKNKTFGLKKTSSDVMYENERRKLNEIRNEGKDEIEEVKEKDEIPEKNEGTTRTEDNVSSDDGNTEDNKTETKSNSFESDNVENEHSTKSKENDSRKYRESLEAEGDTESGTQHEAETYEIKAADDVKENIHPKESNFGENLNEAEEKSPKRRNSTGERHSLDKLTTRRNSLGSEDKTAICTFHKREESKNSDVVEQNKTIESKLRQSSHDPRTERRIRNKDRPSLEIYRPGMGRFSKQRMEREKVLGSSTEVESPSSSPSPTPVMKHKALSSQQ